MLGIIVELAISWLLLWLIEKQNLSALGFAPNAARIRDLIFGLLISGAIGCIYHLSTTFFVDSSWNRNNQFTTTEFWGSVWWTMRSVLYEELLFRGALLYIAIKKIGTNKGCALSAICFGIYHWFSFGAFGDIVQMIVVLIMTGIAGLMFAFAFAKTKSLYLPFGLHFGWNVVTTVVFSSGPLKQQMFIRENESRPEGILSLVIFLFQLFALPLINYWYLKRLEKKSFEST